MLYGEEKREGFRPEDIGGTMVGASDYRESRVQGDLCRVKW